MGLGTTKKVTTHVWPRGRSERVKKTVLPVLVDCTSSEQAGETTREAEQLEFTNDIGVGRVTFNTTLAAEVLEFARWETVSV